MVEDLMVVDGNGGPKDPGTDGGDLPRMTQKRKRSSWIVDMLSGEQKEAKIKDLEKEMEALLGYYDEVLSQKETSLDLGSGTESILNAVVARLIEESDLPLSRLVEEIHGKVKEKLGDVSQAAVKSAVVVVGQRVAYGIPNGDADVLEDQTKSYLWCWETRDAKLLPKSARGALKIQRTCRKKIHERITAVCAMMSALKASEVDQSYKANLIKASEKLSKVLSEVEIRLLVKTMSEKSLVGMPEGEVKQEEKLLIKELERYKRETEKEKKKIDRKIQKEKVKNEKEELKRLQEAKRDVKRREKEEAEIKKQLKKQQEEAERDQRRREKEEAELKKQLALQRQASVMERFLKRSKTSPCQIDQTCTKQTMCSPSSLKDEKVSEAVTQLIDDALSSIDEISIIDLRRLHLSSWHHLGHSLRSNGNQHWGLRKKPKTELFKEIKLTANKGQSREDELSVEKLMDGWREENSDDRSCLTSGNGSAPDFKRYNGRQQLLQFDKSHRPAFYGVWPNKSKVVRPRQPLRKDPELDYDIDSDEEWEEEEPGESLSDCDRDDDEESLEVGCLKADDDDESEDGFFVPDGYLSENEGVQVDRMETEVPAENTKGSSSCEQDMQNEEFCTLLRKQKHLSNLTERALRKNQPLIILNLMHEKSLSIACEDLNGYSKIEQACLQALSIHAFPGLAPVKISIDNEQNKDHEACLSTGKSSAVTSSIPETIKDSDLPTVVSTIQSCSQGINKLVESLQQKLPAIPKSLLRNKVRQLSEFVDNRWQVKKEVLTKLGMSVSPEKSGGNTKSIVTFFSKRCLPPASKDINHAETSPQQLPKTSAAQEQQNCT